jgi:hypothetical protein
MGQKKTLETVSVVNPLNEALDDEYEPPALARQVPEEEAWTRADRVNSHWTVLIICIGTACTILLVVALAMRAIDDPQDSWQTELPVGRLYEGQSEG